MTAAKTYKNQSRYTVAMDCVVFGFDGEHVNILLIKRGFEPEKGNWSLMGGFIKPTESSDDAAKRINEGLGGAWFKLEKWENN